MRLETNEAWIISKVFGEIDIFIYSPLFEPEAFHLILILLQYSFRQIDK